MDSNVRGSGSRWKQWLAALATILPMISVGSLEVMTQYYWQLLVSVGAPFYLVNRVRPITYFGCVIGAIFGAVMADKFGRKQALLPTTIHALVGIIGFLNPSVASCITCLLIGGISAGIAFTVVPMYISEIANHNIRGSLLMLQLFGIYAGKLLLTTVAALAYYNMTYLNVFCIVVPALFLIAIYWFPETPYYLASKKRYELSAKSVAFFRGIDEFEASQEVEYVISSADDNANGQGLRQKIFQLCRGSNQKGIIIIIFLTIVQWNRSYLVPRPALALALQYVTTLSVTGTIITAEIIRLIWSQLLVLTTDLIGRRLFLLGSTLGGLVVTAFSVIVIMDRSYVLFLTTLSLELCQLIIYGVSLVYVGELFSTNVRSLASATVTIFAAISKYIIFEIYIAVPDLEEYETYFFVPVYLLAFVFVLAFVPESKEKLFSEIQIALADNKLKCRSTKSQDNPLLREN